MPLIYCTKNLPRTSRKLWEAVAVMWKEATIVRLWKSCLNRVSHDQIVKVERSVPMHVWYEYSVYMLHDLCIWEITLQCIKRLFVSWHDTQSCSSQPIKSLQSHFLWLQNGWKACLWKNPTETKEQRENACKNVSEQVSEKWRQGYWLAGFKTALFL